MGPINEWKKAISEYIKQHPISDDQGKKRRQLARKVVVMPKDPDAWLEFLSFEESMEAQNASRDNVAVTISKLYNFGWRQVSGSHEASEAVCELGIRLGKYIWKNGPESGRNHFRSLKSTNCVQYMPFYQEWATLEAGSGDKGKALKIISEGLGRGVRPQRALQDLREQIMENGVSTAATSEHKVPSLEEDQSINISNIHEDTRKRESELKVEEKATPASHREAFVHETPLQNAGDSPKTFLISEMDTKEGTGAPGSRTKYGPAQRMEASNSGSSSDSPRPTLGKRKHQDFKDPSEDPQCSSTGCSLPTKQAQITQHSLSQQKPGTLDGSPKRTKRSCNADESDTKNPPGSQSKGIELQMLYQKLPPIEEEPPGVQVTNSRGRKILNNAVMGSRETRHLQHLELETGTTHGSSKGLGDVDRADNKIAALKEVEGTAKEASKPRRRGADRDIDSKENKKKPCDLLEASCDSAGMSQQASGPSQTHTTIKTRHNFKGNPKESESHVKIGGRVYKKLEVLGSGGSSKVFKVVDAKHERTFALKRCKFGNWNRDVVEGYKREIKLLGKLRGKPEIIQLIDWEIWEQPGIIYMLLEMGEIDLKQLLENNRQIRQTNMTDTCPDWLFIRFHWRKMLEAVNVIHKEGIVHLDLKPPNFLVVKGIPKLIDFGIACSMPSNSTEIVRETQIGTMSYMSPEGLLSGSKSRRGHQGWKVGPASDIWSLGITLYQMVYGFTPFEKIPDSQARMKAIVDEEYEISFPPRDYADCTNVLQRCLIRNPNKRITMKDLFEHPFVSTTQKVFKEDIMSSPRGKDVMLRALEQVLPGLQDVAQVSQKLFGVLKQENMGFKVLHSIENREQTQAETGAISGCPEETHLGVQCPSEHAHP